MDRDTIIECLRLCSERPGKSGVEESPCRECPVNAANMGDYVAHCHELYREAADMLEVQEPRLLRLCDVKALERDTDIWLEVKLLDGSPHVRACTVRNITPERLIIHGCIRDYDFIRYGITWNCWTSRPTDEQRKAVYWG